MGMPANGTKSYAVRRFHPDVVLRLPDRGTRKTVVVDLLEGRDPEDFKTATAFRGWFRDGSKSLERLWLPTAIHTQARKTATAASGCWSVVKR